MYWFGWFFEDDDAPTGTVDSVTQTTTDTGGPGGFSWGVWLGAAVLLAIVAGKA